MSQDMLGTLNGLKQLVGLPEDAGEIELFNKVEDLVCKLDKIADYAKSNPVSAPQCVLDVADDA